MSDIVLPQLGETVTEATIALWLKDVGDRVEAEEPIAEVSTDKVDTEIFAPESGVLTEICIPVGETVAVGDVIAVISARDASTGPPTTDNTAIATATRSPTAPAAPPSTPHVELAREPAPVATTRATTTSPSIPAGSPSWLTAEPGGLLLSPEVRRLLNERGVHPNDVTGTGSGGRITPADVKSASPVPPGPTGETTNGAPAPARSPDAAPALVAGGTEGRTQEPATRNADQPTIQLEGAGKRVPLSRIRLATGRHMVQSLATTPHALSAVEIDYSNVDRTRSPRRVEWKAGEGFSLAYLPFITRAVVDALRSFPHLNASVDADSLVVHDSIHIGIAVDLDYAGLMVPVIRRAETKRLRALSREINELAGRARNRKLLPDELTGGTFTITNNGSAGSVMSSAIISQPQVAIVSTDAIVRRPAVIKLADGEAIAIRPIGQLTMSWDHRAFDGAYAAGFLAEVKASLETRDWDEEF